MDPGSGTPHSVSTPDKVAGETKARNRKRTLGATLLRKIHALARERQEAWAIGDRPNLTEALTTDLGMLYLSLRRARRDGYRTGEPEGTAYRGRTARVDA